MTDIDDVRSQRLDLAQVLEKYSGIRRTVEDLYPDKAHFIYELLQNAEDTKATQTTFTLDHNGLAFEHNGKRPFNKKDLEAITNIGEGTKRSDTEKIGRFGIGFKAVFAYTECPQIWSPELSFEIRNFVLPHELATNIDLAKRGITKFYFPFNSPKKSREAAHDEILSGLTAISERTLLFLKNIESISWKHVGGSQGGVLRVDHDDLHVEVLKQEGGSTTASSHFLRTSMPAAGVDGQCVSIAFELDALPAVRDDAPSALASRFRIIEAKHGTVSVFFPAEKETSGLRFHIHGPFVPELSRASIKATEANTPLFDQVGTLVVDSLEKIKSTGLLTTDFLAVLPTNQDDIPARYQPIRNRLVDAFNNRALMPTFDGLHAPAKQLVKGEAVLRDLLNAPDLQLLCNNKDIVGWAAAAALRNSNADRFIESLSIRSFSRASLIDVLNLRIRHNDPALIWYKSKPVEWIRELYLCLDKYLDGLGQFSAHEPTRKLHESLIVRRQDGKTAAGEATFFPSAENGSVEKLVPVDPAIIGDGLSPEADQNGQNAKIVRFLRRIGVREIGEKELLGVVLDDKYSQGSPDPSWEEHIGHVKQMLGIYEKNRGIAKLLANHYILMGENKEWFTPASVYVDNPIAHTGIAAYYAKMKGDQTLAPMAKRYADEENGLPVGVFFDFLKSCGVAHRLEISASPCSQNPKRNLLKMYQGRTTENGVNRDYAIIGIPEVLAHKDIQISRLVWECLIRERHRNWHVASYSDNGQQAVREAPSQLLQALIEAPWIPQSDGSFVRPCEARRDRLPDGFAFDSGWPWIKAMQFGDSIPEHDKEAMAEREKALELGITSNLSLEAARELDQLSDDEKREMLAFIRSRRANVSSDDRGDSTSDGTELPEDNPSNPERRMMRVEEHARSAPDRETQVRDRSVSVNRDSVKAEAKPYLIQQYTNSEQQTVCQICKKVLPFMVNGQYYFEMVEIVASLKRLNYQNYLCLCPNHSAMFKHANESADRMRSLIESETGNAVSVRLAATDLTIYFTKKHLLDLKAVLIADTKFPTDANSGIVDQ